MIMSTSQVLLCFVVVSEIVDPTNIFQDYSLEIYQRPTKKCNVNKKMTNPCAYTDGRIRLFVH